MTQASAGAIQGTAQVARNRRGRFKPGVSGNPSGRTTSKRFCELYDAMMVDLGGESLGAVDRALLSQATTLMIRAERVRDVDDCVRLANASARLLASLRTKHKRQPAPVLPLREVLRLEAAEAAEREGADD
jgi:hypothetical protein